MFLICLLQLQCAIICSFLELAAVHPATAEEMGNIIKASLTKSRALDVIPTILLKQCPDVVLPCLTLITFRQ